MTAIAIEYAGWCEIRLPTNPDPTDESRGTSGYSFALVGEPDFDRVIRFQRPMCVRAGVDQEVGVKVSDLWLLNPSGAVATSQRLEDHVLLGGEVELLNAQGESPRKPDPSGPKFEARGYIIGTPGKEPIYPYHLRISSSTLKSSLDRKVNFKKPVFEMTPAEIRPYGATDMPVHVASVAAATGISDPVAFRETRLERLRLLLRQAEAASTGDQASLIEIAALRQRIVELEKSPTAEEKKTGRWDRRTLALTGYQWRSFFLDGNANLNNSEEELCFVSSDGTKWMIDCTRSWKTDFWFGGWDCDALLAYAKGLVVIPLQPQPHDRTAE